MNNTHPMIQAMSKLDKWGWWQRFSASCAKRNVVTTIFIFGIQIAALLYSLVMLAEIINIVIPFYSQYPYELNKDMTLEYLIFRMLSKGWLIGLVVCIVTFFCNQRIIKWKIDGLLWMFIFNFGISLLTLVVEKEMFLYFSFFSIGAQVLYFLSLLLPKRINESNITTFQQCTKPTNWIITISFIILISWSSLLCDTIYRI